MNKIKVEEKRSCRKAVSERSASGSHQLGVCKRGPPAFTRGAGRSKIDDSRKKREGRKKEVKKENKQKPRDCVTVVLHAFVASARQGGAKEVEKIRGQRVGERRRGSE